MYRGVCALRPAVCPIDAIIRTASRGPPAALSHRRRTGRKARTTRLPLTSGLRYQSSSAVAAATATYDQSVDSFPSLLIRGNAIEAQGSFAVSQAAYLDPDPTAVEQLTDLVKQTNTGLVAHYYMDVELQGVLQAIGERLPGRVGIADSLKMGDMAVAMAAEHDCPQIMCLGVDFMSESVQAILFKQGYGHVPVYRAAQAKIGCSLAESAERDAYRAWLMQKSTGGKALHVIYINTSLETKAISSSLVPTITCTSSNVLPTLLQASAQMGPDLKVLYGPDTYMGDNLVTMLTTVVDRWDDAKIEADLHPAHTRQTLARLRDNLHVFPSGNCVVHHMFGASVVDLVRRDYDDCFVTAHLEVPGEMFEIAMAKSLDDQGVVGSTSNILNFITRKVQAAAAAPAAALSGHGNEPHRLRFILGTEAGMVTSIVQNVQHILRQHEGVVEAEIIFPVAQEAVTATPDGDLALVPGVPGGEGCSTAGGCATCPFMKMNDLDALTDVLQMIRDDDPQQQLPKHLPPNRLHGRSIAGRDATDLATESILYMREFMKTQEIPSALCDKVMKEQ